VCRGAQRLRNAGAELLVAGPLIGLPFGPAPAAEHLRGNLGQDALLGHHHVLWMGDLNYRLDWGQQVWGCCA
jgi:hypothetical protein